MVSERKKTATFPESEIALQKFSRVRRGGLSFRFDFSVSVFAGDIDRRKGGGEGRGPTARPKRDPGDPRLRRLSRLRCSSLVEENGRTRGETEKRKGRREEQRAATARRGRDPWSETGWNARYI